MRRAGPDVWAVAALVIFGLAWRTAGHVMTNHAVIERVSAAMERIERKLDEKARRLQPAPRWSNPGA